MTNIHNPIDLHVGSQLRKRRKELGLRLEDVGTRLDVPPEQVHGYEEGAVTVSADVLIQLCKILNVQIAGFFSGGEMPEDYVERPSVREDVEFLRQYLNLTEDKRRLIQSLVVSMQDGVIAEINVD